MHRPLVSLALVKNLALVWMVQHGGFPGEGKSAQGVFKNHFLKVAASP